MTFVENLINKKKNTKEIPKRKPKIFSLLIFFSKTKISKLLKVPTA